MRGNSETGRQWKTGKQCLKLKAAGSPSICNAGSPADKGGCPLAGWRCGQAAGTDPTGQYSGPCVEEGQGVVKPSPQDACVLGPLPDSFFPHQKVTLGSRLGAQMQSCVSLDLLRTIFCFFHHRQKSSLSISPRNALSTRRLLEHHSWSLHFQNLSAITYTLEYSHIAFRSAVSYLFCRSKRGPRDGE